MSTPRAGGHGQPWTADEDTVIRYHYPRGLSLTALAAAMRRTPGAVQQRATQLGVTRGTRAPFVRAAHAKRPWTSEEEDLIREQWGLWPVRRLAAELGRSVTAVTVRKKRLAVTRQDNVWSARLIGRLFDVDSHLVVDWIARGLVTARRVGLAGPNLGWHITYAGLERFVTTCPHEYDWRRMEVGYWRDLAEQTWRRDPLLTVAQVARLHGVNPRTVHTAIHAGRLPAQHDQEPAMAGATSLSRRLGRGGGMTISPDG